MSIENIEHQELKRF
jgi:hypothetical protein